MKKIFALLFPSMTSGFINISPAKRTVDGALVHFRKALDELKVVKAQQDAEVVKQEKAIEKAEEVRAKAVEAALAAGKSAEDEARRAAKAIAKIEDFIV